MNASKPNLQAITKAEHEHMNAFRKAEDQKAGEAVESWMKDRLQIWVLVSPLSQITSETRTLFIVWYISSQRSDLV